MVLLNTSKISKSYGETVILNDISFNVSDNDKIGILGVNGAGKSTLFKILTEEISPDSGEIYKAKQLKIACMQQHMEAFSENTAYNEVLSVFDNLVQAEKQIELLQKELETSSNEQLINRFHTINQKFIDDGGLTYKSRINSTLTGLGITDEQKSMPLSKLSGGQRTRVMLAKILLENADILLLDEPTNHLDIEAVTWLEDFLSSYKGSIMVVTHDRYFLDKVTNKIFEIENHKLKEYNGNYSHYLTKKQADREAEEKDYSLKEKEIRRLEGIIKQQKQWNREKSIKTAESKQKVIERIEKTMIKPDKTLDSVSFRLPAAEECAKDVLSCINLSKSFDKPVFSDINIEIKNGEKVFLMGANGSGKTTLFKIILGLMRQNSGKIVLGSRVKPAYYDQMQSDLDPTKTIFDDVHDFLPKLDNTTIRSALALFLFRGEDVFKEISTLSGGERARVSLVKLMLSKANFLLLDEPTNHLDIASKEALESALKDYSGTLLIISHDRYFINKLADKIYELTPNGEKLYDGGYDYYVLKHQSAPVQSAIQKPKTNDYKILKELESQKRKLKTKISKLEDAIAELENEISILNEELLSPQLASDYETLTQKTNLLNQKQLELQDKIDDWEISLQNLEEFE
ncbi:MAG: ABC-F family ATP-binding cassette domain-containing protein [Clostridia bacterium]|nr:ABC-F family ATP-binding cassette domain-containing protein [Clostridia bacterium]